MNLDTFCNSLETVHSEDVDSQEAKVKRTYGAIQNEPYVCEKCSCDSFYRAKTSKNKKTYTCSKCFSKIEISDLIFGYEVKI